MWGSNGLRLRSGFSASVRYAYPGRWYSSSTQTVSEKEFEEALGRIPSWQPPSTAPLRIGLAISGGVDSMALAALCSRHWDKHPGPVMAHGIIIDHKMRAESGQEAQWVASQLKQKCEVLLGRKFGGADTIQSAWSLRLYR
ncbi:hypothetical protein K491DRAFT_691925 [Lophiostoma macrostomum CBS 122681]|uniref:tRNA(Ile)-lysidine/2-thiocytidine synthase N-terminal domain-containing protein n=1 Tax=Lophiostoma macrostomum CBS 122681 TaxID=1314788 RepID=A0A6A6T9B5_9PLEO|nr:hypothetical protein K491DRAFT_691925 [Lophiostoma macrostomum CBS 122681]